MTKARLTILLLLSLCSALSLSCGVILERAATGRIVDFKVVYYGARSLIQHLDPYNENDLMKVYLAEGGERPSNPTDLQLIRQVVTLQVYFPTAFIYIAPFALLPWATAHLLWTGVTVTSFTLAAFLMWDLGHENAEQASFYLVCFLLVNCEVLFAGGNPAGITVSFCVIAVWCFLQSRFVLTGILCLAISLAIKPHDTGLVWLYFLLAGGAYRKRAMQTLALAIVLGAPAILWISQVSPHWVQELHSNLSATAVRGGITDPGPASVSGGGGWIIDLQSVISVFRDDPRIYNPVSYLICCPLVLMWIVVTLRSRASRSRDYLALAAIAALSMLPVYHRPHDAKLLLLTVPAFALLLAEGGPIGWITLVLNTAGILVVSDIPLAILGTLSGNLHLSTAGMAGKLTMVAITRPAPLVLLALSIFYLWVYARRCLELHSSVSPQPELEVTS
jgi:hypothetical protein